MIGRDTGVDGKQIMISVYTAVAADHFVISLKCLSKFEIESENRIHRSSSPSS